MIESVLEPLFHKTSTKKHWTFAEVGTNFEIHENNISFESLNYYLSICDSDRLVFGRCASARLTLEFLNINLALMNRNFDVDFTFEDEPEIPFAVGTFTVTEDKPSPDRKARSVTMYDALYFVLNTNYADWYNSISDNDWESMTLGGLVDSFFAYVGITVESASRAVLVNADMPVSKTLATEQLLGSDILFAICQAAGCFGVMTNNNEFRFLYLKSEIEGLFPINDLYPAEDLYPIEPVTTYIPNSEYYPPLVYETYMTPSITKLRIAESTEDVGTTIGSGDAGYEIIGNFLFLGKTAQQLSTYGANTLGAMTQRNYRPFSVEKLGNLCFEIGDPIRLGNEDIAVESYILTRTFSGVQAFTDEISAEGTQDYTVVASSISTTVDNLQGKTLVLKQNIDGVSTELTEQLALDGIVRQGTYAEQTNTKFSQKVSVEYGNHTTDSFSWDMDINSHTWYKNSQQVMRIDGNGLTVTGHITAGSIITAPIITGGSITGNSITGSTIDSGTITGSTISGGTITGATFSQVGSVTSASISNGSISIMDNNTGQIADLTDEQLASTGDFKIMSNGELHIDAGNANSVFLDTGSGDIKIRHNLGGTCSLNFDDDAKIDCYYNNVRNRLTIQANLLIDASSYANIVFQSHSGGVHSTTLNAILNDISLLQSAVADHESRITALENA